MSLPSPVQPVAGEIVLHCAHAREPEDVGRSFKIGTHWFSVESPFTAPSGETGVASWLNICETCWEAIDYDMKRLGQIAVRGHLVWDGDAPVIVEDFS